MSSGRVGIKIDAHLCGVARCGSGDAERGERERSLLRARFAGGATPLLRSEVALPLDTSDRTLHPFMVFWAKQSSDVSRCRVHGSRPRLSRTGSVVSVWS